MPKWYQLYSGLFIRVKCGEKGFNFDDVLFGEVFPCALALHLHV